VALPSQPSPLLYGELASWFHLVTPPEDYAVEGPYYAAALAGATDPAATLLELGCGGGNNASFLKARFACTLTDLSPAMLEQSRRLNPECEHLVGDMRTLRLGRTFDAVFVNDAIMYLTTEADLRRAVETAFVHCRPGGAALFVPDLVRETFRPRTDHGGQDGQGRSLRYLEWTWDPDPSDTSYVTELVYALREGDGDVRVFHDRHVQGVFPLVTWWDALTQAGFEPRTAPPVEPGEVGEVFLVVRPV
jgi:SAM-dependent methyltransferase